MAGDDPTFYLGNYMKSINGLPEDLKKSFNKMLTLDQKNNDINRDIATASSEYLKKVQERHLNSRKRKSEMERIMKMFSEAKENSDAKVNMAMQTYELVDRHIRRLDEDLRAAAVGTAAKVRFFRLDFSSICNYYLTLLLFV